MFCLHGALKPPPYQIVVRRNPDRLLERTQEVPDREIGQPRQGLDLDPPVEVAVDKLAQPSHHARGQPAAQIVTLRLDRAEHGETSIRLAEHESEGHNEELIALVVADMQDPVTAT